MPYEKGQPSIAPGQQQLPQGGATQANSLAVAPADPLTNPPVVTAPREEDRIPSNDADLSENMQILAAPPDPNFRPNPVRPMGRVPRYVVRNIPVLMAAAKDPEAPRVIKALYRAVVDSVERETR